MDALERLKSEMAKYGDIEPKERDEKATLDAQAKALLENAKRLIDALGLIAHNHIRYSSHFIYLNYGDSDSREHLLVTRSPSG